MDKRAIKKLAINCYTDGVLDQQKVLAVTRHLKRRDLKEYIRTLKLLEKQKNVFVLSPTKPTPEETTRLKEMFPEKNLSVRIDNTLLLGLKVIDNDMVYDISLKGRLEQIETFTKNS